MKYELTDKTIVTTLGILYQVRALKSFNDVNAGDYGGYIESVENLSQYGNAWVYDNAWVSGDARVYDNAWVSDNALVSGGAQIYNNARVSGVAQISDIARVSGDARVSGGAQISGDAWVFGGAQISGDAQVNATKEYLCIGPVGEDRYITVTKSNGIIKAGCFLGSINDFKKAVDAKYEGSGDYYPTIKYIKNWLNQ